MAESWKVGPGSAFKATSRTGNRKGERVELSWKHPPQQSTAWGTCVSAGILGSLMQLKISQKGETFTCQTSLETPPFSIIVPIIQYILIYLGACLNSCCDPLPQMAFHSLGGKWGENSTLGLFMTGYWCDFTSITASSIILPYIQMNQPSEMVRAAIYHAPNSVRWSSCIASNTTDFVLKCAPHHTYGFVWMGYVFTATYHIEGDGIGNNRETTFRKPNSQSTSHMWNML